MLFQIVNLCVCIRLHLFDVYRDVIIHIANGNTNYLFTLQTHTHTHIHTDIGGHAGKHPKHFKLLIIAVGATIGLVCDHTFNKCLIYCYLIGQLVKYKRSHDCLSHFINFSLNYFGNVIKTLWIHLSNANHTSKKISATTP